jgi:hypothetical protein
MRRTQNALILVARSATITAAVGMALTSVALQRHAAGVRSGIESSAGEERSQHCALDVRTGGQSCFGTFTEAVAYASGGAISDVPADPRAAAGDRRLRAEAARARPDVVLGTFFTERGYGGDSLTVHGSPACAKDRPVNLNDEWKNQVSSILPWAANCRIWLFTAPGLTGHHIGPITGNTPGIRGTMERRVQSFGFS